MTLLLPILSVAPRRVRHPQTLAVALVLSLVTASAFAQKAHQHGHAQMQLTLSASGQLRLQLQGAMDGFLGFEHRPRNDAQRAAVEALRQQTLLADAVIALPAEAACRLTASEGRSMLFDPAPAKGTREGHADLELVQTFQCQTPSVLTGAAGRKTGLEVSAFKHFTRLRTLELSFVVESGPGGADTGSRRLQRGKLQRIHF